MALLQQLHKDPWTIHSSYYTTTELKFFDLSDLVISQRKEEGVLSNNVSYVHEMKLYLLILFFIYWKSRLYSDSCKDSWEIGAPDL